MNKKMKLMVLTAALTLGAAMTSYAGWKQNDTGYWWQNDDGSYPTSSWHWLDGNGDGISECYYFDGNGYMAANTTTPDGYTVDGSGAWVVDGVVQTQTSQNQAAQEQTSDTAPEKYPLRTTLVKEKYVNLLNKSVDEMFRVMGEKEGDDIFGIMQYTYVLPEYENTILSFWADDGKVFTIRLTYGYHLALLNADQMDLDGDTYSAEDIDRAMGGGWYNNSEGAFVWKISDEYPIYYCHDTRQGVYPIAHLIYGE